MTIITKPITEKKIDGKLEGALLDNEGHVSTDCIFINNGRTRGQNGNDRIHVL